MKDSRLYIVEKNGLTLSSKAQQQSNDDAPVIPSTNEHVQQQARLKNDHSVSLNGTGKIVFFKDTNGDDVNTVISRAAPPGNHSDFSDASGSMFDVGGSHHHSEDEDEDEDDDDEDVLSTAGRAQRLQKGYDVVQKVRYQCGKWVNHPRVQLFIVALIAVNAAMMGIGTFDFVSNSPRVSNIFELVDLVFLIIFTVELGMQFAFYGWRLLLDGWLVFDLVVIVTSWSFSSVQIIRAFRIFRALRLITRIKVMKNLVLALFGVMPRMFAIGLLLFLISYIFAVMFTQLFKDVDEEYFGRIDETFFTLFQIMTLDNWAAIAREVMETYTWAWLPFIVFVIITGFVVVNLIIAVICDAISALHDDEKAKIHGTYAEHETETPEETSLEDESLFMYRKDENVREQLDVLENQVNELQKMQEQTLATLEQLTRQLQARRLSSTG